MAFEKYYLEFDGSRRGSIANTAPRLRNYDFSIEFRARVSIGGSGGGTLFDAYDETISDFGIGIKITLDNTGKPTIVVSNGRDVLTYTASGIFVAGTWYHYVFSFKSYDANQTIWYIDATPVANWTVGAFFYGPISGGYNIGVNWNEDTSVFENYFNGDILLFGYYVDHALIQAEVTERYNYWNFHRGVDGLSWGSNIDDGTGSGVATDVLGGVPCVLAAAPNNPIWHLYGAYADPVFELWRDWDDIISMCLLPFGLIAVAAQVIVAACSDANGESIYDTAFPEAESKYDATALYLAAIDAAVYTPMEAETKYDGVGVYFSAIDYEEIYIGHKFLEE